jgi:uncharacterized protein with von Willebrand factor type A (vWA) domain
MDSNQGAGKPHLEQYLGRTVDVDQGRTERRIDFEKSISASIVPFGVVTNLMLSENRRSPYD